MLYLSRDSAIAAAKTELTDQCLRRAWLYQLPGNYWGYQTFPPAGQISSETIVNMTAVEAMSGFGDLLAVDLGGENSIRFYC